MGNVKMLNVVSLNRQSLNMVGELIKRRPSSGGGGSSDIPDGYEAFLVEEGEFLVEEGVFYVKQ